MVPYFFRIACPSAPRQVMGLVMQVCPNHGNMVLVPVAHYRPAGFPRGHRVPTGNWCAICTVACSATMVIQHHVQTEFSTVVKVFVQNLQCRQTQKVIIDA